MYYLVRQKNATLFKRLYELTFLHTSHCNNGMNKISEGIFFQDPISLRDSFIFFFLKFFSKKKEN